MDAHETSVPRRVCVSVGGSSGRVVGGDDSTSHSRSQAASRVSTLAKRMPRAERGSRVRCRPEPCALCLYTCTVGSVVYVYVVVGDSRGVSRDVSEPLSLCTLDGELVDVCEGD